MSAPEATWSSLSLARWRSRQIAPPARVTATSSRTSWRSGWAASASTARRGSLGRSRSAAGGTTTRSTAMAHPMTLSGQAIRPSSDSRSEVFGSPSCSTAVRAPGSRSVGPRLPRIDGSATTSSAVSTSANSRGFWSQPAAATWRSVSSAARASGSVTGVLGLATATIVPYAGRSPIPSAHRDGGTSGPLGKLSIKRRRQREAVARPANRWSSNVSQSPWHEGEDANGAGDGAPPPAPTARRRPRRPAGPLVPTLLVLVVLAALVSMLAGFWTDLLWYRSVGFGSVFTTRLGTQILLFFVGLAVAGGLVWGSLHTAYRTRPFYIPSTPAQQSLEQYRSAIEPIRKIAMIVIPLFLGGLAALTMAGNWKAYLLWRNGGSFGVTDPQFGKDAGFYVFTLPWIQLVIGFLTMVLIMALLAGVFVHYVYGGLQLPGRGPTTRATFVHLGILGAALFLVRGAAYWFGRYAESSADGGIVTGITYTAAHAVLPTKAILAVASVICAMLFLSAIWTRTWRLPLVAVGLLTVLSIVVGGIYPGVIQSLKVKPSEKSLEAKYIQRNIDATRAAYGLTGVQTQVYSARTDVAAGQLHQDAETIPGIRIMDPNVISSSFRQSQAPRSFYTFPDTLDVDRYTIGAKSQDAVVAVRELTLDGLPPGQRNWVNDHTVYTHGYGFVAAYGNQRTSKGDPVFFQQGFSTVGPDGKDYEPRIYFGETSDQYSIVGGPSGGQKREFDYPAGTGQINNTYTGTGGVAIGSFLRRVAYAVHYREPKFLLSDQVTAQSRLLDHRTPTERVE